MSDYRIYLETSGAICSVALYNGSDLLSLKETEREKSHASLITVFISELLEGHNLRMDQINHVVISEGPGSYTGLRVGYSTAKGICYAMNIPLVSVNSLEALAFGLSEIYEQQDVLYCPIVDARRMEVFCALYDSNGKVVKPPEAIILDEKFNSEYLPRDKKVIFGGSGVEKLKENFHNASSIYNLDIKPSARLLHRSASKKIENKIYESLAYAEPFYLKSVYIKN